jgi:hypothetical protein
LWITGFSFTAINPPNDFIVDLQNIRVELSTTSKMPDGLSSTFAENVGTDNTVVYSGLLRLNYVTFISLQTPFLFDPAQGNLLMDVRNFATPPAPSFGVRQFLGEDTRGDTISSVASLDVNSPTARVGSGGMVTLFQVTAVPEPSTLLLLLVGGSALVVSGWRRKRSAFGRNDSAGPQPTPKKD